MMEDFRPDKIERIFTHLLLESCFALCQRLQTSAALFTGSGQILAIGRNGVPSYEVHCTERSELTEPRHQSCLHAERNLLNRCARLGIRVSGHDIATLHRPCYSCANDIVTSGISGVYYLWDYDGDANRDDALSLLRRHCGYVRQIALTQQLQELKAMLDMWRDAWTFGLQMNREESDSDICVSLRLPKTKPTSMFGNQTWD